MEIKVFGPGCANCRATAAVIEQVLREKGMEAAVTKVEDFKDIAAAGILSTPGVAIDGTLVHAGGVPSRAKVEQWIAALGTACCGGAKSPAR